MKELQAEREKTVIRGQRTRELAKAADLNLSCYSEEQKIQGYERIDFRIFEKRMQPPPVKKFFGYKRERIEIVRYFLCGDGGHTVYQLVWNQPLTKGILLRLREAQQIKKFCRFEIWGPEGLVRRNLDPVLVGFTEYYGDWGPHNNSDHGSSLRYSKATFKICEWK